jgi:hypothetical protein
MAEILCLCDYLTVADGLDGSCSGAGGNLFALDPELFVAQDAVSCVARANPMRIDTDDYPVLEKAGLATLRRLYVTVERDREEAVWRITPRIDFNHLLTPQLFTLPPVTKRTTAVLRVVVHRICTYVGAKIEIVRARGPSRFVGFAIAFLPLAPTSARAAPGAEAP